MTFLKFKFIQIDFSSFSKWLQNSSQIIKNSKNYSNEIWKFDKRSFSITNFQTFTTNLVYH